MKKFIKSILGETSLPWLTYHRLKALIAATKYGFPARKLTVIGITGTDGKTTTVGMTAHILNACGKKCGALSTAFFQIGTEITWNATQKTSPSPVVIQRFLKKCVDAGCTHAVLECSSHGLLQGRLNHTYPLVAGITNFAEEHLDYHKTMEAYLEAKSRLFRALDRKNGVAVLNADDRSYEKLKSLHAPYRIDTSAVRALSQENKRTSALWLTGIVAEGPNVSAVLHGTDGEAALPIRIPVAGAFNLRNALTTIGCVHAVNVPLKDAVNALATFRGIPGRMERIDAGQTFSVYVDFTVTPQSYEATLSTLKKSQKDGARLLVLTGSCGDRMKEKRPIVGKIVSDHADIVVVTNEDPYTEDPEKIIDDVWAGIDEAKTEAHRIFDRREAIAFLLQKAMPDDIVLLCGKGSDTTMMLASGQVPWNEREIVREELAKLGYAR